MANSPQSSNNDTGIIIMIAIVCVILWGVWHVFHQPIIEGIRVVRHGELWVIERVVSNDQLVKWSTYLSKDNPIKTDWNHIRAASMLVGAYFRYPVGIMLGLMAFFMVFSAPKTSFKKAYSLDRLIAAQAKIWPVISPIVNFNPAEDNSRDPKEPMTKNLPVFAEAMSPEEWVSYYNVAASNGEGLDHVLAGAEFAKQLGQRWHSPMDLPWSSKALFAAFALKAARKREAADELLGKLAQSVTVKRGMAFTPDYGLRAEIMGLIRDPKIGGEAEKVCAHHAFATTALMRLLTHARERGGVLAPAQFLWLRGADRGLWYPLNNLGRESFHAEAAGAMAHYQAERAAGKPLLSPKIKPAIEAMTNYYHQKTRNLPALT